MLKMIVPPFIDQVGLEMWSSAPSRLKSIIPEAEVSKPSVAAVFSMNEASILPQKSEDYHFLIVDDNEINLRIFRRVLQRLYPRATVDVLQLSTAVKIESLLDYHIVFLDIEMPDVTGVDIARSVRSCPDLDTVGLIAVTTRHMLEDIQLYQLCGFDHTFPKPVSPSHGHILDEITRVLQSRRRSST